MMYFVHVSFGWLVYDYVYVLVIVVCFFDLNCVFCVVF